MEIQVKNFKKIENIYIYIYIYIYKSQMEDIENPKLWEGKYG